MDSIVDKKTLNYFQSLPEFSTKNFDFTYFLGIIMRTKREHL